MGSTAHGRLSRLPWPEKLGFGFGVGDLGFNLSRTTIASFLAAFYTDVFWLSAASAPCCSSPRSSTPAPIR
jgi:GPH family glycoside/pentoside/hexuronide:cation symporter